MRKGWVNGRQVAYLCDIDARKHVFEIYEICSFQKGSKSKMMLQVSVYFNNMIY